MSGKIVSMGVALLLGILLVTSCSPGENTVTELPPSLYLPDVPRISAGEVKAKLDAGANIIIIDSRSMASYQKSHIAGAISIPLTDMSAPYNALDSYDEIITYCT